MLHSAARCRKRVLRPGEKDINIGKGWMISVGREGGCREKTDRELLDEVFGCRKRAAA